jgi:dolichol-phosphate mannosyltransferase
MDISIIIPCYNEVDNLSIIQRDLFPVIENLSHTHSIEVIFVDDGSRDNTLPALQELLELTKIQGIQFRIEVHDKNRGLGQAIRTGFAAANGDVIITTDSDGTYKFTCIPDLLAYLTDDTDLAIASPYHPNGGVVGVPAYRLMLSRGSSLLYRFLVSWRLYTYTSLFRAYRRQVIDTVHFDSDGFLAGTEILVKAILKGYRVKEYPAVLYRRVYGTSKAKLLRTILAHLGFQCRVFLHRLHIISIFTTDLTGGEKEWQQNKHFTFGEIKR